MAGWVHQDFHFFPLPRGKQGINYFFGDFFFYFRRLHLGGVLGADQDGVQSSVGVSYLRFAVRPEPFYFFTFPYFFQFFCQLMRQYHSLRQEFRRLLGGKAIHYSLVAGSARTPSSAMAGGRGTDTGGFFSFVLVADFF